MAPTLTKKTGQNGAESGKDPSGLKEIGPAWLDEYMLCFDYYSNTRGSGAANLKRVASGMATQPPVLCSRSMNIR